jgi:hypothetical protein
VATERHCAESGESERSECGRCGIPGLNLSGIVIQSGDYGPIEGIRFVCMIEIKGRPLAIISGQKPTESGIWCPTAR